MRLSPRPRKFDVWKASWPKNPSVLRDARPERELVAILFLELEGHVDHVRLARRLVDLHVLFVAFKRLEVPELIQPADAVFQRLTVERIVLDECTELPPNHVVARRRVAGEDDAVDEELLAFSNADRDVHVGRLGLLRPLVGAGRHGERLGHQRIQRRLRTGRIVAGLELGKRRELHEPDLAVDLPRLVVAIDEFLAAIEVPWLDGVQRPQKLRPHARVALEIERPEGVLRPLGDRNSNLDPLCLTVLGVLQDFQLRLSHTDAGVATIVVVVGDLVRILLELGSVVRSGTGDEREEAHRLVVLQLLFELAVAEGRVADEVDLLHLDLRTFVDVEGDVDRLRGVRNRLDGVRDPRIEALLHHHFTHDAFDLTDPALVEKRIGGDDDAAIAELLFDLRAIDLLAPLVGHDLDAIPFLHVIRDDLSDHAVGEGVVVDLDRQVVEEALIPHPFEIIAKHLLGRVVVREPLPLARLTRFEPDVIEIGLAVERGVAALLIEAQLEDEGDGPEIRRRRAIDRPAVNDFGRELLGRIPAWRGDRSRLNGRTRHGGRRALRKRLGLTHDWRLTGGWCLRDGHGRQTRRQQRRNSKHLEKLHAHM